jgi:hypothetical protein
MSDRCVVEDPRKPCPHAPGSPGKVAVLRARARLRVPLFLPLDATAYRRPRARTFAAGVLGWANRPSTRPS